MEPSFPFDTVISFGFICVMLLSGIALRGKIRAIQKCLFPGCLVGGLVGMVLLNSGAVGLAFDDFAMFAQQWLEEGCS